MSETMRVRTRGRSVASRRLWTATSSALLLYVVAVGLVQFFDRSARGAQLAQLRQEGRLVPVACKECSGLPQVLSSVSDGRVLLVFAVLVAVAVAGGLLGRGASGPRGRAGQGWLAT